MVQELNQGLAHVPYNRSFTHGKKASHLKHSRAEIHNAQGVTHAKTGQYDLAIADFNRALELDPDYAEAYCNRGITYDSKGEYERAIKDYNTAIELNPDFAEAYNNRGMAYGENGEHDQALQDFSQAIELKQNYAIAYSNRGAVYNGKGERDQAIRNCNIAIGIDPNYAEPYNNRGTAYRNKGEVDLAIQDYTKAIELKQNFAKAHYNRGIAYYEKREIDLAIEDYTKAIELSPQLAPPYNNRGNIYSEKEDFDRAIKDYTKAIELSPQLALVYYNRAVAWLRLRKWEKAKNDFTTAKQKGVDIIAMFHNTYKDVETFERRENFRLPEDLALLLTQRRRERYPKTQKVLDADGKPLESPNVLNLLSQLRDAGTPLGKHIKTKTAFGINITPTEAFVVDQSTRDKLIAAHPSSADILKPFLDGKDLRRWHVDTPQQWLIYTHRRIAINDYPAILKYLEKYRGVLRKRKGNQQKWYELQASLRDTERFAQPKLVCPDTYNHQTFAVDTAGYYYGKTAYLIPTEETWLCGLLNSRTVEWFYSQVSNQLTIDPLRARSGYIQQIPIPDITTSHKALIAKIVDYLIYLQQQPTINSKDLKYARDHVMLGYFERVIDGLVYEAYLPEDLHKGNKHFFQPLLDERLPLCEEIQGDKMPALRDIFEILYERTHPIRRNLFFLDSVKPVRVIQGKL